MSKVLPQAIEDRPELNLRLGIKSSLSGWKPLIASTYLFSQYWKETGDRVYAKEVKVSGKTALDVSDGFSTWITANWSDIPNVLALVKGCSLYTAQIEHLQVGLGLFLKLAEVRFCDTGKADSAERTGGERFAKSLSFGSNIEILSNVIRERSEADRKQFIGKWLADQEDAFGSVIKEVLVAFTEECQFKLRTSGGELVFMQDGIYDGLKNPSDTVESSDSSEPVGPFRILKSYVKEGMHPYLTDSSDGFKVKSNAHDFMSYAEMVKTALKLIPKRTTVYHEISIPPSSVTPVTVDADVWQSITYGAPGTGKSYKIKAETAKEKVFRTTFHPDSDYATFVGAYKPVMKKDGVAFTEVSRKDTGSGQFSLVEKHDQRYGIGYKFVEQVFTQAYIQAWAYQKSADATETPKRVYLIIEEINRGNCAQVFGDLFQLLDRKSNGFSDYAIKPDSDFGDYIAEKLGAAAGTFDATRKAKINNLYPEAESEIDVVDEVLAGRLMLLPDNLYIRATMNTSDQSLFPMDSAFKRRWDWDYVAIKDHPEEEWEIEIDAATHYRWWDFLEVINKEIFKATSSEDKQLGYFFARTPNKKIDLNMFVNKVVFYLWNSVFKDCYTDCEFLKEDKDHYFTFTSFFNKGVIDPERAKKFLGKLKGLQSKEAKAAASRNPAATTGTDAVAATTDAGAENA